MVASTAETASRLRKLLEPSSSKAKNSSSSIRSTTDARADASRLDELRRILTDELKVSHTATNRSTALTQWYTFLQSCRKELVRQLCERIANTTSSSSQQQLTACRTLWGVIASQPFLSNGQQAMVDSQLLAHFIRALTKYSDEEDDETDNLPATNTKALDHLLQVEWFGPYHDVQYYTLQSIATIAQEMYMQSSRSVQSSLCTAAADRLVELLWMIPLAESQRELDEAAQTQANGMGGYLFPPPKGNGQQTKPDSEDSSDANSDTDEDEENDFDDDSDDEPSTKRLKPSSEGNQKRHCFAYQSIQKHRSAWTKAWLAVLRLPISDRILHQALRFLPHHVLPVATRPLRWADFFIQAYTSSNTTTSLTPMLALEGLFILMTQHGLEYNDFYKQLYKLMASPDFLYVKHRRPFLRLVTQCLMRNDMLPAHVVAAFIKRLLRNSLSASPGTILFVLALCSNLLRKHPEALCLVHRVERVATDTDASVAAVMELEDGFDAATNDPEEANALHSSLWELQALEHHYSPSVVTLALSIGRNDELKAPLHATDDFLSVTYSTLFGQERNKRVGKRKLEKVALTFQKPTTLFVENDVFAGMLSIPK